MNALKRVVLTLKIALVSGWLAWNKLGSMKPGDETHFHFVFKYPAPQ